MENIDIFKIYCFLFFIVILLLWKFWKDFEFKNKYFAQIEKSNENQDIILKEIQALSIEITDNAKKIEIKLVPELPKNILPDKLYKKIKTEIKIIIK